MNGKKIAVLAFVASLVATTLPSYALTGTVTVKWNTQAIANMVLTTQATASQTRTAGQNIYWAGNGSTTSGCADTINTASAGVDGADGLGGVGIIDFSNVTPDAVDYTDCLEINAINAFVTTNDTNGYNVKVGISAAAPANYGVASGTALCEVPNGAWPNNGAYVASGRSAAVAITSTTACPAGDFLVGGTVATSTTIFSAVAASTGTNLPADMELVLGPNIATGAQAPVVTYTLTTL